MTRSLTNSRVQWEVTTDRDEAVSGKVVGSTRGGQPVYVAAGGANMNITTWIPIEYDSAVVQRVLVESVAESQFRRVAMSSKTKSIPRSAGITVSAGTTYVSDTSTNDDVTLTARRFIARVTVDEDDLADANGRLDVLGTKALDWAISYADVFDNACLAVTGTENGTTVPFTSVYKTVRTTDSNSSYVADVNYTTWDDDLISVPTTPAGTSLYDKLSYVFKLVETGKYWNNPDMIVIAAPGWRDALRLCVDAQGRPIFQPGNGTSSRAPGNGTPDMLFQTPIYWSRGCKTSAVNSGSPTGNDLLFYANKRHLARGDRSGPETLTDDARAQDDTDDYAMKFRTRRAFKLTHEYAAAVLERITD